MTNLNKQQFEQHLIGFEKIPPRFGSQPVPANSVRVSHHTSFENIENIKKQGLLVSKSKESYKQKGTESPSIFMNAGSPSEEALRSRPIVEAHVPISQLDVGSRQSAFDLETNQSTVTTNVDVPSKNILAIHEPWHQTFHDIMSDPETQKRVMRGWYDNADEDTSRAVKHSKIVIAATTMLGGAYKRRKGYRA